LFTIGSLAYLFTLGHEFDLENSMRYGVYYFKVKQGDLESVSLGLGNSILMRQNNLNVGKVLPHEMIHTYQYSDYFSINSFFKIPLEKFKSSKLIKPIDKYVLFDLPYMGLFYVIQPKPWHFKNFYEFEAQHFATRAFVDR